MDKSHDNTGNLSKSALITYKNWRGEVADRHIEPIKLWYGATPYHKKEQWLLKAYDLDKQAERDFALQDISQWIEKPNKNDSENR